MRSASAVPKREQARVLMVQGTTSDAGKSTLVAALCRWLHRRGVAVAPFKPQNMALNSAVTVDGGEIGRAQALQAQAAGSRRTRDMNPVLLKPNTRHRRAGHHPRHVRSATWTRATTTTTRRVAMRRGAGVATQRLRAQYDAVVVEGAGSPAEINLRDRDIANMGFAEAVDCPVVLVADIDRGGVFAQLVGTWRCLSRQRARAHRRLRHQPFPRRHRACCEPGLDWLEARDRQAGARRAALSARAAPRRGGRDCRRAQAERRATRSASSCRRCRASATTPISTRCARIREVDLHVRRPGRCHSAGRPDHPARQQEHARRPGVAARAGLGRARSRGTCATAAR